MWKICLKKGLDKIEKTCDKNNTGKQSIYIAEKQKNYKTLSFFFFVSTTSNFSLGVGLSHSYNETKIKIVEKLSILSHKFN